MDLQQSSVFLSLRSPPITLESVPEQPPEDSGASHIDDGKILCIIWKNGKMGAAYYSIPEKLLYVYEEMIEQGPDFFITRSLYREVSPKYVLTFGTRGDSYIKVLSDCILEIDVTTTTDSVPIVPPNLHILPKKEYSFETCRVILSHLSVSSHNEESEVAREYYINSLINFDYKMSVYAAGALVKYLDKNWAHFTETREQLVFLHIQQITLQNHLLMDWTTFNALQVFQQCSHDAGFKRGLQSSNREGLSVFRLFSSSCKSKLGLACLRSILLNPLKDSKELNKRLDFIAFVLHPAHQDFIESLQDNIKNLTDINLIISKIQNSRANSNDWNVLYKSIHNTIFVNELGAPYKDQCELLTELHNSISMELIGLMKSIGNALDFTNSQYHGRPQIKFGLDQYLDAKKLLRQDITKHVTAAARIAVNQLPDYLHECAIVYLPEMGHLISIKEWETNCNPDQLQELGYQFMFSLRGTIYYKNPMCLELDQSLGDINAEIIAHENRILQRLSSFILIYNKDIREPLRVLALIDSLIAMAKVAAQNNYIRPNLNNANIHDIQDCRHPLLELVYHFEANDFKSGERHSHIKIITGPNGSGKSIYLKQVALVIYLAHIGSYVPARSANIAMMHSIHTRMHATESASVRLSAFMIDMIQTTQALHNARSNSLILLDEFGRGTIEDEGFALLVGVLKKFEEKDQGCPHVMVSTHFQRTSKFLPQTSIVDHLKMEHSKENGALLYLYKVSKGISSSFAFDIAAEVGWDQAIIDRAREIFESDLVRPLQSASRVPLSDFSDNRLEYLGTIEVPELDE